MSLVVEGFNTVRTNVIMMIIMLMIVAWDV